MMLWEVDIYAREGMPDRIAQSVIAEAADLGLPNLQVSAAYGYLIQGEIQMDQVARIARELLADDVVQRTVVAPVGDAALQDPPPGTPCLIHVLPKPGVMDPVALSAAAAIADMDIRVDEVRTVQKYWLSPLPDEHLEIISKKILANDAIERVIVGPLDFDHLEFGAPYDFQPQHVVIRDLDEDGLARLSRQGQLYLQLAEMVAIQSYYEQRGCEPTDIELETLAQTWSEHCSHKTLAGRISYRGAIGPEAIPGEQQFDNMLKETIFAATQQIRSQLGDQDWCVSVFEDNAGIIRFDEDYNVVFKVETHNHPSALEPYGGANTGIGGVIRDPLGTGMGAKPVCNTDVFRFAPPDTPADQIPPGVLHPRRVLKGVVAGVRDYGNRMGIPTVNGAIYFDPRYLGNPLVYCGNVGILPRDKSHKQPRPQDFIVAVGGRTGRDGIHGATFSSAELTDQSDMLSGGAVQIGNAVTEKMVVDVVLAARDQGLYSAITDCGAGGFSSAVGEMGEHLGAEVWLERATTKYDGLSYTEIWISEAQERMVLAVPEDSWEALAALCSAEDVEATIIGKFVPTGRLQLKYNDSVVGDLPMEFLHGGRPKVIRQAAYLPPPETELSPGAGKTRAADDAHNDLLQILGSLNVASKEWVIRQYDHEVQGGSVIKPLVGVNNDGPSDAAVVRPRLDSRRGLVVACGMNPYYGDLDTYHMAASAIDEAIRNCVAVGADPTRIAILDNFCWGDCERSETLGSLVRAAMACREVAVAFGTPFVSGKDSLNNEFSYEDEHGQRQTIAIPASLLISALGQVQDVGQCVTSDLKAPGNLLYQVGFTKDELGGSHLAVVRGWTGGRVPRLDVGRALDTYTAIHRAITGGLVRACHDLSEGGLAVAVAEMAFAGGYGASIDPANIPCVTEELNGRADVVLFSESNSRFLCEVEPARAAAFEDVMGELPWRQIGSVTELPRLKIGDWLNADLAELKDVWQRPLVFD